MVFYHGHLLVASIMNAEVRGLRENPEMARVYRQAAVIPFRVRDERVEIALVTTLSGKKWVIPKGSLDDGEQSRDAAIRETEEEAGLIGDLEPKPLGRYHFTRSNERYVVDVYLMRVTTVFDHWQEDGMRRRRWIALDKAAAVVGPELQPFIRTVERLFQSGKAHLPRPMTGPLRDEAHS
jgi:8-oxo-dGTP pyrophosphatase MutT (NUDIX family)